MDQDKTDKLEEARLSGKRCPACGLAVEATVLTCPHDGTSLVNPIDREPEFKDKYEFIGTIGVGGMGVIYKARQTALNKLVAIKMLHPHMVSTEAFRRFQIEGRAVSLLHHPYIINVHDLSMTESGQPYMVMDYVDGRTLAQVIEQDGPLELSRFLRIFSQICVALAHAHNRGVLHRDLKPSNIMITIPMLAEEEVRIMDFGIAKLIDAAEQDSSRQLTRTGETIGSPQYMSPEQARGGKTDQRSDLYSLGCVMYEALTGAPPFSASTALEIMMLHLNEKPVSLSQSLLGNTQFNPDLEVVIARLLEKNPDLRYQSMEELQAALQRVQSGQSLDKFTDTAPERKINWQATSIGVVIGVFLTVCLGVVAFNLSRKSAPVPVTLAPSETVMPPKYNNKSQILEIVAAQNRIVDLHGLDYADSTENDDFAPLENATNAVEMDLSGAHIDDLGLQHIGKLQLEKLKINETEVKDLHALRNMTTLNELELKRTPLNDKGMSVLGHLTSLSTLDLSNTGIVDADLHHLTGLKSLRELHVHDCSHLTTNALASLQSKLPFCEIDPSPDPLVEKANELMHRKGQPLLSEAAQCYEDASKQLSQSPHPNLGLISRCLKLRAQCFIFLGGQALQNGDTKESKHDFAEVSNSLQQAEQTLEKARSVSGPGQTAMLRELCDIYTQRAKVLEDLEGNRAQGIVLREKANNLADDQIANKDPVMIENQIRLGVDYRSLNKFDSAEAQMKKAVAICQKIGLDNSSFGAYATESLADTYCIEKKFKEALPYYEQTIRIMRKQPVYWNSKDSAGLRWSTAVTYDALGREAEAERVLKDLISQQPDLKTAYPLLIIVLNKEHKPSEVVRYVAKLKTLR